jgi:hypothetical protein
MRPRFVSLGFGFLVVGLLHLIAWLYIVFIYHANAIAQVRKYYLPVYGLLGGPGVWIFLLIILLNFVAAVMLIAFQRHSRTCALVAAVFNLPIIPLGTMLGLTAIVVLYVARQDRI